MAPYNQYWTSPWKSSQRGKSRSSLVKTVVVFSSNSVNFLRDAKAFMEQVSGNSAGSLSKGLLEGKHCYDNNDVFQSPISDHSHSQCWEHERKRKGPKYRRSRNIEVSSTGISSRNSQNPPSN
ncbi:hypothetical protein AMTR_s00140p00079700 [Amborella trichopoda]|uniref:Uncharacterized protein n=1 Tax=Amborella trichopoda TaxID=13333 RepID=W1PB11_AMBTC|nr:hypothetical protein AMTR_s00140p00079700 [Amborella trichopoda]